MTVLPVYIAACIGFCAGFAALGIVASARGTLGGLWADIAVLGDKSVTDDEKERHARKAAFRALAGTAGLTLRLVGVLAAAALPVWLADAAGLADAGEVADYALRLDVLAITTVAMVGLALLARRLRVARA